MIAFVNQPPTVEHRDGVFFVTLASGGEAAQFALTRHALRALSERGRLADIDAIAKEGLFEATPFQRRRSESVD